jgi:hypothetical protein
MNFNTQILESLSREELVEVGEWCAIRAKNLDPVLIAERKKMSEYWDARKRQGEIKEAHDKKVLAALKPLLVPGMRLKMRGCKDGKGYREFIRWDERDNLVCWQLQKNFSVRGEITRTNQVTTHYPDKVMYVNINGVDTPIKKLL